MVEKVVGAHLAKFGTHPHRAMEIITCVLEGGLQHRDSMGNRSVIHPGEVLVFDLA
jgi:quercetin 2,3-dioxygenase